MDELIPLPGALSPWLNAAGFFGYTPPASNPLSEVMGAFITSPISRAPRSPAHERCIVEYPGGFLLHTGYPNEGFTRILKQNQKKWAGLKFPVWPHLLPQSAFECQQMVRAIEDLENIGAVEISLPPDADAHLIEELVHAAAGELPVYVSVPLLSAWQNWLDIFQLYNMSGIVLSASRGSLVNNGHLVYGRLYGPSLFPQLLAALQQLQDCGIPLIAGSGIFTVEQAEVAFNAGASAVQFDARLWQMTTLTFPTRSSPAHHSVD